MVEMLLERYPDASVASLDLVQRHFPDQLAANATARKWSFHSADLTSLDSLSSALRQVGATTVFHTASPWTGSGPEVCEKVNVQGTQTVVDACVQEGVNKLVFTSSAGTVYDGNDLKNVDERMPFPDVPIDAYNVTKVRRPLLPSARPCPSPPRADPPPHLLPRRPRPSRSSSPPTARAACLPSRFVPPASSGAPLLSLTVLLLPHTS